MRRVVRDYCMLALAALMAGCGGGAGTGEQRVCSADTFVPNYVRQLDQLLYWERFPVTVYFERDATTPTTTERWRCRALTSGRRRQAAWCVIGRSAIPTGRK